MRRILVVDDEPALLQLVRSMLAHSGVEVRTAQRGAEALELLHENPIDMLLTDILMPGMSGTELIREVHRQYPGLPVSYMTGYITASDPVLEGLPLLAKPFGRRELLEIVESGLARMQHQSLTALRQKMEQAQADWRNALSRQDEIAAELPTGMPPTDGVFRIRHAGRQRSEAWARFRQAAERYHDALKLSQQSPAGPQSKEPLE